MPGLCLASWKHTSKVMGGSLHSGVQMIGLLRRAISRRQTLGVTAVTPGKQQIPTAVSTSERHESSRDNWVWKWEHCGQVETLHRNQENTVISGPLHTYKWVSVSHQPWVHDLTWGLTHRLHLNEEDSTAPRPTWCLYLKLYHRVWFKSLSTELPTGMTNLSTPEARSTKNTESTWASRWRSITRKYSLVTSRA